ncbi:MAG: hypothetical protein JWQ98_1781 [Chlorobi bacterium]|nr:hypothetical protein [Chlorobiota bacterium]
MTRFSTSIKCLTALFGLLLCMALPLKAQDDPPPIDLSRVPVNGASPEAFVPSGWKIEEKIVGDLDRDGVGDVVLDLIQDLPAETDDHPNNRSRALLVLLHGKDGAFHRKGAAAQLLCCTLCGGTLSDPSGAGGLVTIQKGVIVVSQMAGSREMTTTTHRFRQDPATGSFMLIGLDAVDNDRLTGDWSSVSTNYITGVQISESHRTDRKGKDILRSKTTKQVTKKQRALESAVCGE